MEKVSIAPKRSSILKYMYPQLSLLILAAVINAPSYVQAARVLPVFTDQWYEQATAIKRDSCYVTYWNYRNKADKTTLLNAFYNSLPMRSCFWTQPSCLASGTPQKPTDFPSDSLDDYNKVVPKTEYCASYCINGKGETIDRAYYTIHPSYRCPQDTAIELTSEGPRAYCATEPGVCGADVVGRDLLYSEWDPRRLFGHVGLAGILVRTVKCWR